MTPDDRPPGGDPTLTRPPRTEANLGPTLPPPADEPSHGYEILEELGRGGMGVVYKARHMALNRIVALKMVLSGAHASEDELARFRTEAEALSRLQHPGIVALHSVGSRDGVPFLEMEFCPGGSLDRKLAGTPMPPRQAAALVAKLADAIQAAHDAHVLHRDLKPTNVLLSPHSPGGRGDGGEGEFDPKITDFGLAKKLDEQGRTQTGAFMGTPSYAAPEQARGEKDVGPAADVYSLGAILYECLTGRPPFRAATVAETLMQVLGDEPPSPRTLNPAVPLDLDTIALKCLQKDPTRRYASARDLADDLGRHLRGEPIQARPVGVVERGTKWVRRNPALAAMAAVVSIALASATVVSTLAALSEREQARKAREALGVATAQKQRADDEASEAKKARGEAERSEREANTARDAAQEEARRVRLGRHGFLITAALQAWQAHDVLQAEALLRDVPPEFQGTWEYRHLRDLCRRKATILRGHEGNVTAVACSPDGRLYASASEDGTVRVWEARTGREMVTFNDHKKKVWAVVFSPDSRLVASGGDDAVMRVWEARTGREVYGLEKHEDVKGVIWSPDGTRVASLDSKRVTIVELSSRKQFSLTTAPFGSNWAFAYSPDGRRIVTALGERVKVLDVRSGGVLRTLETPDDVYSVACSPDGHRLAAGGPDGAIRTWDANTGELVLTTRGHTGVVEALAYSPDGLYLASASRDRTVRLWDARTGQPRLVLRGHASRVSALAFSPDGTRLLSGGWDGVLRIWDPRAHQEWDSFPKEGEPIQAVAYSPDGRLVASGGKDHTVRIWDAVRGRELLTLQAGDRVYAVAFSPDGQRVTAGGWANDLRTWDVRTGRLLRTITGHTKSVAAVAYRPNGQHLASSSYDGTVRVWDAETGRELMKLKGRAQALRNVEYSPDGSRLVAASGGRTVKVWDARTGRELHAFEGDLIRWSPDGHRILSASFPRTLRTWDAQSGKLLSAFEGQSGFAWPFAFSPDGIRLALGSSAETLHLWDAGTGQVMLPLAGHHGSVNAVAFSPDGSRLVSASEDGTLGIWAAPPGPEVLWLRHEGHVWAVAFSPDGRTVYARSHDEKVLAWDAATGRSLAGDHAAAVPSKGRPTCAHGNRRAYADGPFVCVERLRPPEEWQRWRLTDGHAEANLRFDADCDFHDDELDRVEKFDPFATAFHVDRLLALDPVDRPALLERRAAALSAALKKDPNDHWAASTLARQAVADFTTIEDPKLLLTMLVRHPHAAADRLYGAVLLRTGNAREAAIVFRAAIRNRRTEGPPLDELLLALALIRLDRHDEAQQQLAKATAWMDRGTIPLRAAALIGLAPGGPLAALGSVAQAPRDQRLDPLDGFTAHELASLRAEAERLLREGAR